MAPSAGEREDQAARAIVQTANATTLAALADLRAAGRAPKDDYVPNKIFLDYSALYLNWLDRLAHLDLGSEWRPYIDGVSERLFPLLQRAIGPNVPEAERAAATDWVSDLIGMLMSPMVGYTVVPEMREATVIYEIGRSVALSAGWPDDATAMGIGSHAAAIGLNAFNAEALIGASARS